MRISLVFENKFDSARLNENVTAFMFCMNNFCCGSKYTETKIILKRPFIAAGEKGTTLEKPKNDQLTAQNTFRSRGQKLCL